MNRIRSLSTLTSLFSVTTALLCWFLTFGYQVAVEVVSHVAKSATTDLGGPVFMRNLLKRLWQEEEGQDLVEYGLLIFLIALAAVASMKTLASSISTVFSSAATSLTSSS
jgi:pilus assembly protein Flp/PilA